MKVKGALHWILNYSKNREFTVVDRGDLKIFYSLFDFVKWRRRPEVGRD